MTAGFGNIKEESRGTHHKNYQRENARTASAPNRAMENKGAREDENVNDGDNKKGEHDVVSGLAKQEQRDQCQDEHCYSGGPASHFSDQQSRNQDQIEQGNFPFRTDRLMENFSSNKTEDQGAHRDCDENQPAAIRSGAGFFALAALREIVFLMQQESPSDSAAVQGRVGEKKKLEGETVSRDA